LDTPSCEANEISSSCNLSVFSSKAGSQRDEGAGVAPGGSSSASIGKLWPGIDELDEICREGTSCRGHQGSAAMLVAGRASINDILGPSSAPSEVVAGFHEE
jgi:hypothetical protein